MLVSAKYSDGDDGGFVAKFRSNISGDVPPGEVSLARIPDHCFFELDCLAEHDNHVPTFKSRELVEAYVDRVFGDIDGIVTAFRECDQSREVSWLY